MTGALVLDVPVELGLEFVPIVDLERSHAGGVFDGGVLVTFDGLSVFTTEDHELDIHLDLMVRNLLLVTGCMNLAEPRSPQQPVQAIALKHTGYAGAALIKACMCHRSRARFGPSYSRPHQTAETSRVRRCLGGLQFALKGQTDRSYRGLK